MADRSTDDVENHRKLLQTVKNAVGAASSAAMPSAEEYYVSVLFTLHNACMHACVLNAVHALQMVLHLY